MKPLRPILEITKEECAILARNLFSQESPSALAQAREILEQFRKGAKPVEVVTKIRDSRLALGVSKWPFNSSKPVPLQGTLPLDGPSGTQEKTEPWRGM